MRRARLVDHELDEPEVLLVVERGRLTGRSADHDAVGAVLQQVVKQAHGRGLVDAAVGVEGRHHRRENRSEVHSHLLPIISQKSFQSDHDPLGQ